MATQLPAGSRPMVAVLDARPGRREQLRRLVEDLAPAVRAEPGCQAFLAFAAQEDPGRFYLYEVYRDGEAFERHLRTAHVRRFMAGAAEAAVVGSMDALIQLVELDIPDPDVTESDEVAR